MPEKKTISEAIKKAQTPEVVVETPGTSEPDYKALYLDSAAKLKSVENKTNELEKLCKSYAELAKQAQDTLQNATLEYNAKTEYMLDCVKHAYLSIQFALTATTKKKDQGGKQ